MPDQPHTPPQTAQEPPTAPPAPNGNVPPAPETAEQIAARIAREVTLTWRAVEEVDARLQAVQVGILTLAGLCLLIIALELRKAQR